MRRAPCAVRRAPCAVSCQLSAVSCQLSASGPAQRLSGFQALGRWHAARKEAGAAHASPARVPSPPFLRPRGPGAARLCRVVRGAGAPGRRGGQPGGHRAVGRRGAPGRPERRLDPQPVLLDDRRRDRRRHLRRGAQPRLDLRRRARQRDRGDRPGGARGAARAPPAPQPPRHHRAAARAVPGGPAGLGGPRPGPARRQVRGQRPAGRRCARPLLLLRPGAVGQPARGARRPARHAGGAHRPRRGGLLQRPARSGARRPGARAPPAPGAAGPSRRGEQPASGS